MTLKSAALTTAKALGWVVGAALTLTLLLGSAYVHLSTPVGRQALGDLITHAVSSSIEGELAVEGVRSAWLPEVEVDRVVASVGGVETLDLRDVRVHVDALACLYHGGFIARSGRVGRGHVNIQMSPSGEPWIERGFSSAGGSSGGGWPDWLTPPGRSVLRVEGLSFERVRATFGDDGTRVRLVDAGGRARLWVNEGEDFQARFWGVSGALRTSLGIVPDANVHGVAISVDPAGTSVVTFAAHTHMFGSDLTLAGHAPHTDGSPVRLCVWTGGDPLSTLLGVGGELATGALTDVSLDVRPSEAPDAPSCRGASS